MFFFRFHNRLQGGTGPTLALFALAVLALSAQTARALDSPQGWYEKSPYDLDGNKIEDRIELGGPDSLVNVFVCFLFDCRPADRMAELQGLGAIGYESTLSASVQVAGISVADLQNEVSAWPEVGRIMSDEPPEYFMNTAGRAIKAHAGLYSPNTVEDQGFSGSGVTIAILDSGVDDLNHPDLPSAVGGLTMLNGDSGVFAVGNPPDRHGHGTEVAGAALGRGDAMGNHRGTAPGASLFDAQIEDSLGRSSGASVLACIEWIYWNWNSVTPPIRVVNISFGWNRAASGSHPLTHAVNMLAARNITAVVAAGNHGDCDTTAAGDTAGIGLMAASPTALTVGAMDHMGTIDRTDDVISGMSREGGTISWVKKPDVVAYGGQCTVDCPDGGCVGGTTARPIMTTDSGGGYVAVVGTSIAAPQVAGLCAAYVEAWNYSSRSPVSAVRSSAEDLGAPGWDPIFGHGLIDPGAIEGMGLPVPPQPCNLAVWWVSHTPEPVVCGEPVTINVAVKNLGPDIDSFTVDFQRYYFGPNDAPAQLFSVGNGPEWNDQGTLKSDSIRIYQRTWTPGVSDSLPVSQHSCFWGVVDAPCEGWPDDNRRNENFTVTGLTTQYCGTPLPPGPVPPGPTDGHLTAPMPDDDTVEIPLAISHDKNGPLIMDIVSNNADPDNWIVELISPEGDIGPIVQVMVDPQECLTWVTLRAWRIDPSHEGPTEVVVHSFSDEHGMMGEAVVLIDPNVMSGCCVIRGDADDDGTGPDIADLVFLVTYMFQSGEEPACLEATDIDGSGSGPDVADLVHLVTYMFQGGPPPAECP